MGPESWDHRVGRVGTAELGLENWTGELGPESWESWDQRAGTRELRPESWDRRELGPESWDQELGPESWDQEVGPESWDQESWDQRGGTSEVELGPEGVTGVRRRWDGNPPEMGQDS